MTPSQLVVTGGFEECVETLLPYGADGNIDNAFEKITS